MLFKGKEAKKISDAGGGGKQPSQQQPSQQQPSQQQPHKQQQPSQEEPPYVSIDKTPELKPKIKEISTSPFLSTLNDVSPPPAVDRSVKPLSTIETEKSKNKEQVILSKHYLRLFKTMFSIIYLIQGYEKSF